MATVLTEEQVLEMLLNDDEDHESREPDNDEIIRCKVVDLVNSFDGGVEFNHGFFRDTALGLLLPIVQLSQNGFQNAADFEAFNLISSANCSPLQIIRRESKYWLEAMYRRLGGKNRIRNPFYSEVKRDIPSETFGLVARVVKNVAVKEFCPPLCFHDKNKKAEIISFTNIVSAAKLLCLLSGITLKAVMKHLRRSFKGGRKKGYKVKVLVSDTKDLAFLYKFSTQQLTISFHYGEWNSYGFPQHV